jgi:hypothetical protein
VQKVVNLNDKTPNKRIGSLKQNRLEMVYMQTAVIDNH